jgi:3-oxo-5alpha-steroid 4-dehydrogenase
VISESERSWHDKLYRRVKAWAPFRGKAHERAIREAALFEAMVIQRRLIRARRGVLLSTGGFVNNLSMLRSERPEIAEAHGSIMRLGSMGCDGSGIALARSVGADTALMDRVFVGRNISPPNGLLKGMLVNLQGVRFINEDAYTGLLGEAICRQSDGGRAWLILNGSAFWDSVRWALRPGRSMFLPFGLPALLNAFLGGTRRSTGLADLAVKCRIDVAELVRTAASYNRLVESNQPDPFGKAVEYLCRFDRGPFYAVNMAINNAFAITPVFTLGGLRVDEESGAVLRGDGQPIEGLYAAGRVAVGLCSLGYMSGMSIADTVFSGRRAGRAISLIRPD